MLDAKTAAQHLLNRCGSGQRSYPKFRVEKTEQQHKDLIDSYIDEVRNLFEWHYGQVKKIDDNTLLSQEGKNQQYTPIQQQVETAFNRICSKARQLQDQHLAKVDKAFQLPAEIVGGDPVILEMRCREVRRHLLSLPVSERIRLALSVGDAELLHAIDTAPACLELLPADVVERSRKLRVQRKRGQMLIELEDERMCLVRINEILNAIPGVFDWIVISPTLWPLPESVFPLEDDNDPADPAEDPQAIQMAAGAKLAAEFMQQ